MPKPILRTWQLEALDAWENNNRRGIVRVVTGGGKTVFALSCIDRTRPPATLIIVPTTALLEQWWEESANYFDLKLDEINIVTGALRFRLGTINIVVLNTAAKLANRIQGHKCLLIVDECHKAASDQFRAALQVPMIASLGLSATPERPYDNGLEETLIPALGPVIYKYDYHNALRDSVIVPFVLKNIVFELEPERQIEYDTLSQAIGRAIDQYGIEAEQTVSLFLKRTRVLNLSLERVRLAVRLTALNRGKRTLIFHEDIEACNLINDILVRNGIKSAVYHSQTRTRVKAEMLHKFRQGVINVLVTCRSLDEGFNVPETEIGIIAASTATQRQRIQRLGRIVRPAANKANATIYTLIASGPEIARLKQEEESLEGVATVHWSRA